VSKKISSLEPAERLRNLDLSDAEVLALVRYHVSMTKKITKYVGKALLNLNMKNPLFSSRREGNALIDEGKKQVVAHIARVTALQSILKS